MEQETEQRWEDWAKTVVIGVFAAAVVVDCYCDLIMEQKK
jgi:hypothetical protein